MFGTGSASHRGLCLPVGRSGRCVRTARSRPAAALSTNLVLPNGSAKSHGRVVGRSVPASLRPLFVGVVAVILVTSRGVVWPLASPVVGASAALAATPVLTPSQLAGKLSAAVNVESVPQSLDPPLRWAADAKPPIVLNGCSLQRAGVRSRPCVYGDTTSHTSVALFGDSHAAAWFPALELISKQQRWRLVDFTKAGCPTGEVDIRFGSVPYRDCTAWRRNTEAQIAALRPTLVIVSGARWMELEAHPQRGVRGGYGSAWLNGLAATFSSLSHTARKLAFISDVPTLPFSAPGCVASHKLDLDRCDTERNTAVLLPQIKSAEIALATRLQVNWIDPTPWFCTTTTCPAVVGNILLYRDNAHMTPAWSRFVAPVLADTLVPIMDASSSGTPTTSLAGRLASSQ